MKYSVLIILGLLFVALFINGCVQKSETAGESTDTTSEGAEADEGDVLGEVDTTIMEESDDVELGDLV